VRESIFYSSGSGLDREVGLVLTTMTIVFSLEAVNVMVTLASL
jgi:hypothetical protein